MGRCVDLVDHLDRVRAEAHLALGCPAVGGVGEIAAKAAEGDLVAAHRRSAAVADRTQVGEVLVGQLWRPLPGEGTGVVAERLHLPHPVVDRGRSEVPRQHLVAPSLEHRLEDLRFRMQERHTLDQHQTCDNLWRSTVMTPQNRLLITRIDCETIASDASHRETCRSLCRGRTIPTRDFPIR
jgi:hypothetical protein